jgi:hypothetical protein
MGTYQVPVPVLALPRWRSFPVWALAKCLYQYWHCRDGVLFQYGYVPSAHTSIVTIHYQQWQIFAADTDEFYHTLEKLRIRKGTLVSSSMGTSTGSALPRTGIGNLRIWVTTYKFLSFGCAFASYQLRCMAGVNLLNKFKLNGGIDS